MYLIVPDEAHEDEYDSDDAADGLDVRGVFATTSCHEVIGRGQRNVFEEQRHRQLVVQRNQRVALRTVHENERRPLNKLSTQVRRPILKERWSKFVIT